ncbi:MAG: multidrug efflux SMR transporter [Anaerovoracaceae bacterium]
MLKKGSYKMNRSWIYVYLSGITEILWAIGLKYSDAWWEWVLTFTLIIMAFVLTIKASEALPVATVYVVFTGIGAVGTNLVDILVFREPVSVMKIVFIVLLIAGIIGLKLVTDKPEDSGVHDSVAVAAGCFAGGCSNDTDGCCVSHTGANAEVAALEAADSKQTGEVR